MSPSDWTIRCKKKRKPKVYVAATGPGIDSTVFDKKAQLYILTPIVEKTGPTGPLQYAKNIQIIREAVAAHLGFRQPNARVQGYMT